MAETIRRNPEISIVLEFSPSLLERANYSPIHFFEELIGSGFNLLRIDDATGELSAVEPHALMTTLSSNLLLRKGVKG
jgi:hypothetical protein